MADEKISSVFTSDPIDVEPGDLLPAAKYNGSGYDKGAFQVAQLMFNRYKIVPTVVSNDLVLSLKHEDGTDPSATVPLYFKIGDAIRAVTGALSVTVADGVNTFNAGSAELATKEIDYFVYLGYRAASSAVVMGFSRIPYANLYSEFSATATNGRYAAFSTAPASSDDVIVIGRFAATLSAGAGYTWTVPTYTSTNLIQRPIYETRPLNISPTFTGFSAAPSGGIYRYIIKYNLLYYFVRMVNTGTSNATTFTITIPLAALTLANMEFHSAMGSGIDNGANLASPPLAVIFSGSGTVSFFKDVSTAAWTASSTKKVNGLIVYDIT